MNIKVKLAATSAVAIATLNSSPLYAQSTGSQVPMALDAERAAQIEAAEAERYNVAYRAPRQQTTWVRIAVGLDIDERLEPMYQRCGFAYGPWSLTGDLYEKNEARRLEELAEGDEDEAAEYGWCGDKTIRDMDNEFARETMGGEAYLSHGAGVEHCANMRGSNLVRNRSNCRMYVRTMLNFGTAQYADVDRTDSGQMSRERFVKDFLLASAPGVVDAAANRFIGGFCRVNGGCGGVTVTQTQNNDQVTDVEQTQTSEQNATLTAQQQTGVVVEQAVGMTPRNCQAPTHGEPGTC